MNMSVTAIIWFLVIEFVLALLILGALYLIDWLAVPAPWNRWCKALVCVLIGAVMLIKLLNFVGIS